MIRKHKNGIYWLEFNLLTQFPKLKHGIFLRHGGSSFGNFSSLNLSEEIGDNPEIVTANRTKVAHVLENPTLVDAKQVHGTTILDIISKNYAADLVGDGLSTSKKNLGLLIKHADCQAAIFYDPVKHITANIHCGWKGSIQNIYAKTVSHMHVHYGCSSKDIIVCISPSLGPENAEFVNYKNELPKEFWKYQIRPNYFDFWHISSMQLQEAGILLHNIEIAGIDTFAAEKDFFSYRRSRPCGRNATVAILL